MTGGYLVMNKMMRIDQKELISIKKNIKSDVLLIEISADKIHNWADYINILDRQICFPDDCTKITQRYDDWMTDLSWIDAEGYCIIFYNYTKLENNNPELSKFIIDRFMQHILPFWEREVQLCVVGGKIKNFNVYLVN